MEKEAYCIACAFHAYSSTQEPCRHCKAGNLWMAINVISTPAPPVRQWTPRELLNIWLLTKIAAQDIDEVMRRVDDILEHERPEPNYDDKY